MFTSRLQFQCAWGQKVFARWWLVGEVRVDQWYGDEHRHSILSCVHMTISSHLTSFYLNWAEVSEPQGYPRRDQLRPYSATYFVLIGRSHGKLGRFTAHLLPLTSNEMRSVEIRSDELRSVIRSLITLIYATAGWRCYTVVRHHLLYLDCVAD